MGRLSFVAFLLAAVAASGCGLLPEPQAGLACQQPADAAPREAAPQAPPVTGKTPAEAEEALQAADLGVAYTWRYSYGTDIGNRAVGYSECWCIPPPDGEVTQVEYASEIGQFIVFVRRSEPIPGGRAQPVLGWGCDEA